MWLNVSVYCPAKGYFAAVFEDITERMWERIADRFALALSRTIAEEALREERS